MDMNKLAVIFQVVRGYDLGAGVLWAQIIKWKYMYMLGFFFLKVFNIF
jgi:hypothetical protein